MLSIDPKSEEVLFQTNIPCTSAKCTPASRRGTAVAKLMDAVDRNIGTACDAPYAKADGVAAKTSPFVVD